MSTPAQTFIHLLHAAHAVRLICILEIEYMYMGIYRFFHTANQNVTYENIL